MSYRWRKRGMEVELFSNAVSEEDTVEVDVENDNFGVEGERCGICMDIVIDRGVLDCCQHWFCFACIDNWATITNLCPLCQNEFQLITCVPVYDTIGGSKTDEGPDLRDDDWRVEGKNNTLSFPSYYIDENAVTCLDGNGCKIRSESVTYEENLTLDTSIACDSCDTWYHAFCVGFDPDGSDVDSWLCPRCLGNEAQQKSDLKDTYSIGSQLNSENTDSHCLVDTFCGKVFISVADAGETAVVVSTIGSKHVVEDQIVNEDSSNHHEVEQSMLCVDSWSHELGSSLDQRIKASQPEPPVPSVNLYGSTVKSEPIEDDYRIGLGLGLSLSANGSVAEDGKPNIVLRGDESPLDASSKTFSTAEHLEDVKADIALNLGEKRKRTDYSASPSHLNFDIPEIKRKTIWPPERSNRKEISLMKLSGIRTNSLDEGPTRIPSPIRRVWCPTRLRWFGWVHRQGCESNDGANFLTNDEDSHDNVRLKSGSSARKVKTQRGVRKVSLADKAQNYLSDDCQKTNNQAESSARENMSVKEASAVDIMCIVREPEHKTTSRVLRQKEADRCAEVQKNAAKLRVKKIMRRPCDDKESADVVQKLRKEIREAVRKKPSDDVGKNIFDPNLLAAFRAAIAGCATEPVKKASVKAKKLMLQKGKTRENLTKKIYTTSNGRRRRAWDRDCEVEFWKHRCMTTSKTEKIETLRSVLNLLRESPGNEKFDQHSEDEVKTPLLSRLYLADASLFPRKDDIKPLSVLKAAGSKQKAEICLEEKDKKACPESNVKTSDRDEVPSQSNNPADDKKSKSIRTLIYNGTASAKLQPDKQSDQKKMTGKTNDIKVDKRKWALEVLARKTASNSTSGKHEKQDNAVLKGNYLLLGELPPDMWPKPAPVRHNKIPVPVRQTQLYRLAEHFLKMANLSSIQRTGATELAVADAINIEKQVADRSNSKAVYLNLCSQEVRYHLNSSSSCMPVESPPTGPSPLSTEGGQSSTQSLESEAEAALRAAGLLSDSPPSSPPHNIEDIHNNEDSIVDDKEEGMENILEMDSHPDLDIYGDFEYDLDEDFVVASALKAPEAQVEEGESKVKVVFSTLNSNKTDHASDAKEQDLPKTGIAMSTSCLLGSHDDAGEDSSAIADEVDSVRKPADTSLDGEGEELSLAECEALYGPEKEPLVKKFPVVVSVDNVAPQSTNSLEVKNPEGNTYAPNSGDSAVGGRHPSSSQSVEKEDSQEDKIGDPKVDKQGEHTDSVLKKVEAYIKEHIRPLCKSGVITVEQYRWAVGKTAEKVMKYHSKAKSANFLIKEGEKVKKLAEQYVEAAKHKEIK
ncbi:hypothetical protein Cgig2_031487 [Carnegiea gigantea]|uniref:Uncharacterized protein n=1 Tax=Carnegiea gigantea TaxID=171969 RepID=A0A9Q1QCL9_9CARY|nr:hypothetical protein Cgig2_031487 [Carnegiea gigantea]